MAKIRIVNTEVTASAVRAFSTNMLMQNTLVDSCDVLLQPMGTGRQESACCFLQQVLPCAIFGKDLDLFKRILI